MKVFLYISYEVVNLWLYGTVLKVDWTNKMNVVSVCVCVCVCAHDRRGRSVINVAFSLPF